MNFTQITSLIIMGLSVSACGGGGGSSSPSSSGSSTTTGAVAPAPKQVVGSVTNIASKATVPALAGQSADIIPMQNNIVHVVNSLLTVQDSQRGQPIADNTKIYIDNSTDLDLTGPDISLATIVMPTPTVLEQPIYHCYQTNNLTVGKQGRELHVDGVVSEYETIISQGVGNQTIASCSNIKLSEFTFNNAVINEALIIDAIDTVSYEDTNTSNQVFLPTYQFTALVYEQRLRSSHGDAWAIMQNEYINNAAKELGNHLFEQNLNSIEVDISALTNAALIDFESLDKTQLLNGALWGMPGQGVADQRWCKIVNMPENSNAETLKYQTIIATNCARSTKRWCNVQSPVATAFDPVGPVAWSDTLAKTAQNTANVEQLKSKNAALKSQSLLANVSEVSAYSAIKPLFGYADPTPTNVFGQSNNAGSGSQAGRVASCSDMMDPKHTEVGIGYTPYIVLSSTYSTNSFWTHIFN